MSNRWSRPKRETIQKKHPQLEKQLQITATQTIYSAPIPPPQVIEKWEEICPGSANRILTRFEKQGEHRQDLETTALNGNLSSEKLGQIFAFILFMTALIGGFVLVALDKNWWGFSAIISALVIPTALFLLGRRGGIRELLAKRQVVEALTKPQKENHTETDNTQSR